MKNITVAYRTTAPSAFRMGVIVGSLLVAPSHEITAIGVFLLFGAVMAFLAGTSLARRGTRLDRMWVLNTHVHHELAPFGKPVGLLFLSLAVALTFAGIGWLKHRR
jgi:hypothetical protein